MGDVSAHYNAFAVYLEGRHDVKEDGKRLLYHLEEAAIGGHPDAIFHLRVMRRGKGRLMEQ